MLGLSRKTDYALLIVTELARHPGEFVSVRVLAEEHRLPYRFASQIVGSLKRAGILESHEGVKGGYCLSKEPSRITLEDVLSATEGGVFALVSCLDPRKNYVCPQKAWCGAKEGMGMLQRRMLESLKTMTVADFLRAHESSGVPTTHAPRS